MGVWDLTRPCQTTGDCVSLCHLVGTFFLLIPGKTGSVAGDTIIHQTHQTASQFSWNLWTTREHKCAVRHHSCLAMGVLQPLPSVPPQLACLSHPPARMWTSRLTALSGPQGLSWKPRLSATPGSAPSLCPLHPLPLPSELPRGSPLPWEQSLTSSTAPPPAPQSSTGGENSGSYPVAMLFAAAEQHLRLEEQTPSGCLRPPLTFPAA